MTSGLVTARKTWARIQIEESAIRAAQALCDRGVAPGDRVVLKAHNSFEYVAALLALIHLDTSIILLDGGQLDEESRRLARRGRARWALLHPDHRELAGVDASIGIEQLLDEHPGHPAAGGICFERWRQRRDALIAWSSGSTGVPKGVVKSGTSVLDNLERTQARMRYRSGDVLLPLIPFSHQYGLSMVLLWWLTGCSLVVSPPTRLDEAFRLIGRERVTAVDATPSTYHTILNLLERRPAIRANLDSVRMWCVGGAPLSHSLAERFARVLGQPLLDGYGSTEAGNVAVAAPDSPVGCGAPLEGVDVRIADDAGRELASGAVGEIWVRSPALMEGYLTEIGGIAARTGDWYRTGDLGSRDGHGNLHVLGRKFAVHRHGHTLYPEGLERKAEAVGRPVKVVPVGDERRGSQLLFFVEDPDGGGPEGWRRRICEVLAAQEQPNRVIVVRRFPLNRNGKVDLAQLRRMAAGHRSADRAQPALRGVHRSRQGLATVPFGERVQGIRAVLDLLRSDPDPLAAILGEISNHNSVRIELESAIRTLEGAVTEVATHRPGPVPRMAVFMPSNVMLYSYVLYALVPALFVERIAFRPSAQVSDQVGRLHRLLAPVHGLPIELEEVSQRRFLRGSGAAADVVVFTGTYQNAESVRAALREDQLFVFFGQGVNPFVVTAGADVDLAVHDAVEIRMLNSGQDCLGPDVFFVHRSILDRFLNGLTKSLAELRFGDFDDPRADYGPLFYDGALSIASEYLRANREHIVYGGRVDFRSRHLEPAILLRELEDSLKPTELFAPIFNLVAYDDVEALCSVLSSGTFAERALGASVYGRDDRIVEALAQRHAVSLDMTLLAVENGNRPFGGYGPMANYISYQGRLRSEPILLSKTVAEWLSPEL